MNKFVIILAVIADTALVANVYRHWEDKPPELTFQINCNTSKGVTVCLAHNDVKE